MLRIVTGPFLNGIEPALVDEVRRLKTDDPLAPLALLVPSGTLRARLCDLLVCEQGLSLLNVHFLTFHQLALTLDVERRMAQSDGAAGPVIVSDLLFEHLLREVGRRGLPGTEALRLADLAPGGWAALWATLRDLKDAAVDPTRARDAVDEGQFGAEDGPKLRALFMLHAAMLQAASVLGVGTADDLAAAVTPWVPDSRFLTGLRRVLYYGFYDLTQVQLALLEAVVTARPATIFFPLEEGEAFAFARRFYDRHVRAIGQADVVTLSPPARPGAGAGPERRVMNAVGPEDELALVCKEILSLVETRGYAFDEIGVVARTPAPYAEALPRLFDQHRIPFTTTAGRPLLAEPAAKVLVQLARLPLTGFYRAPVLDILTSPFAVGHLREDPGVEPRPDLWQLAVRAMGITRGEAEWRRLAAADSLAVEAGTEADGEGHGPIGIPAVQLRLLWRLVSELMEDCRALPGAGTVGELTAAFLGLAARHFNLPGLTGGAPEAGTPDGRLAALGEVLRTLFGQLRELDRVPGLLSWEEWVGLFTRSVERASLPIRSGEHRGVQVLDAMAARGLPFRALFLVGMNDQVFPRSIREDAFLRDRHRQVLAATLGYKIDEKLAAHDEERLLFALLGGAARDQLYLSYQRADGDGRPLAPSLYLAEGGRAGDGASLMGSPMGSPVPEVALPRRLSDRFALPLWAPPLLTREELGLWLVLTGSDPEPLLEAVGREPALFRNGRAALVALEGGTREIGPYDGLTGPLEEFWARITARGLAPTALEQYARCPFQYFAAQVLRLKPLRRTVTEGVPAQAMGQLCHDALDRCYRRLVEAGWPEQDVAPEPLRLLVGEAVEQACGRYATEHGTGYALVWQMARETVTALVTAAVEADRQEFLETGFRPLGFEVEADGRLEGMGAAGGEVLKVRGRWDRVDRRETPPGLRVVDYKFRQGRGMKPEDRDLPTAAIRGYRLQPPLYALMTQAEQPASQPGGAAAHPDGSAARPDEVTFVFLAPRWEPPVERSRFESATWQGETGGRMRATLTTMIEGIRAGRFLILPDGYCDYCEFSAVCRRLHGGTWWRAHRAPGALEIRRLRRQKAGQDRDG